MDFDSASHGLSIVGMRAYMGENRRVFDKVCAAIDNTKGVTRAINQGWNGQAADNFIKNILTGANNMKETVNEVEKMLQTELEGIQSQIVDMDENLVELE